MIETECGILIRQISNIMDKRANNILREKGLSYAQVRLLLVLRDEFHNSCEFKQMEKHLEVAQSTTVTLVNKLEKKGLLESYTADTDRRTKIMKITERGLNLCDELNEIVSQVEKKAIRGLSEKQLAECAEVLKEVYKNLQREE